MSDRRLHDFEDVTGRWNRVFNALAAEPRRRLVATLMDASDGGPVSLPEAATSPPVRADPERLVLELRHRHLPLLADADYVEWQSTPFTVSRGVRFAELEAVLDGLAANAAAVPTQLQADYHLFDRDSTRSSHRPGN